MTYSGLVAGLEEAFNDVNRMLRLRRRLATLKQTNSVASYISVFRRVVLDMGTHAPDE